MKCSSSNSSNHKYNYHYQPYILKGIDDSRDPIIPITHTGIYLPFQPSCSRPNFNFMHHDHPTYPVPQIQTGQSGGRRSILGRVGSSSTNAIVSNVPQDDPEDWDRSKEEFLSLDELELNFRFNDKNEMEVI